MSKRKIILIVDDDEDLVNLLYLKLSESGFKCYSALNGTEAITSYEKHHPDLIIMDRIMPGIDGLVAMRKIRGISGSQDEPKILMLTVKKSITDVKVSVEYGANDYMVKPVNFHSLHAKIKTMLKK